MMFVGFVEVDGPYDTYSLSVFVVRTSGSLPKRPMRVSFAISAARELVVEKAWTYFSVSQGWELFTMIKNTYACRRAR